MSLKYEPDSEPLHIAVSSCLEIRTGIGDARAVVLHDGTGLSYT